MLIKDRFPEAAPLDWGVKVTVNGVDEPAVSVKGNVIPDSTNSLFVMLAEEIVTDAPVAFRLPLSAELDPSTTFPKFNDAGETANCPGVVPVPERAMESGELDAFETIDTVPLAEPALVGAKVTVNVTLWLEDRVVGNVNPLTEYAAPVTLAWDMVTADPPVFVTVSDVLLLLPT